jgi:TrmH RNA methyltransferase
MIEVPVVPPLTRADLSAWAGEGKTGLVLHSVGNDHNLGAIIRAAAFFDAPWIVLSEKDPDARLSSGAYRVAEGGMEHVLVRSVRNTAAFLTDASKQLFTIAADRRARQRIRDLPEIMERSWKGKPRPGIALILGNEERGLPPRVQEACATRVRIPGTGLMESLNVSQAAAVFLHEIYEL